VRHLAFLAAAVLLLLHVPAFAQTAKPADNPEIVVEGRQLKRKDGKPIAMSSWRVAETDHLLVYAGANDERLIPIAHNLEKLHFLLSILFNRADQPDDTLKLRVTLFGDETDFKKLNLRNTRWQMGPFSWHVPAGRYYDPGEDGAMMAVPRDDQQLTLRPGRDIRTLDTVDPLTGEHSMAGFGGVLVQARIDALIFEMKLESRIYAAYAQHYLLTYFPAAYPRWYLDGFGEIFGTMESRADGVIEYGRAPEGLRKTLEFFGPYSIDRLVDGSYLEPGGRRIRWSPYHAWAIAHLLFLSEEWQDPLNRYLAAVARGASTEEARAALGDTAKLQALIGGYRGRKIPYEQLTYPAERIPAPLIRQLTRSEAAYVKGKLELGARMEETAEDRESWLRTLRDNAAQFPEDLELQLLLAEAECRSGNNGWCIAAADRVLAVAPQRPAALAWKGVGTARQAVAGPADQRRAGLKAARALMVRANRGDPEAVVPLLAYYRSFSESGEKPSDAAARGLIKASEAVPSATVTRLMLGEEYARRGNAPATRQTLRPVAIGAYDSPERPRAKALLESVKD
jgi:hypothetical protein